MAPRVQRVEITGEVTQVFLWLYTPRLILWLFAKGNSVCHLKCFNKFLF